MALGSTEAIGLVGYALLVGAEQGAVEDKARGFQVRPHSRVLSQIVIV
jgi:hypothetical protein